MRSNSIWNFTEQFDASICAASPPPNCIFCDTPIEHDKEEENKIAEEEISYGMCDNFTTRFASNIGSCPACGWWRYEVQRVFGFGGRKVRDYWCGRLKTFGDDNISAPIEEVRSYLAAKYDDRFRVDPELFEQVVGSVFGDLGYASVVTAYSGDGGIDVVLSKPDGSQIGVQVKRYKNAINVEQIRSLTGALVLGGYTKGIFVTTSSFQRGAEPTAEISAIRGYPIELIDGPRFYDALKLAQIESYGRHVDRKPWQDLPSVSYLGMAAVGGGLPTEVDLGMSRVVFRDTVNSEPELQDVDIDQNPKEELG